MTKTTSEQPEPFDLRSHDTASDKISELLRLFPEIRTEGGKLDFDRLKLALGESVDVGRERYGMNWSGKADCFKTIQAPSMGTLRPCREESVNFDTTENLIIEGDNLEVLKLLQKSYLGKVKMIYIDPPYNTGNDFIYPDNYSESLNTYLQYTGQVDDEGRKFGSNTEADGRFHSKWMNMMYPRLYLARNLLRECGLVFVSIDEKEVINLRNLLTDIFGEENFVCQISVVSNPRGRQSELIATTHEYIVCFARNIESSEFFGESLNEKQLSDYRYTTDDGRKFRTRGLRHRGNASLRSDRPKMYFPLYVNPNTKKVFYERSAQYSQEVVPRKSTGEDGRWEWGIETVKERIDLLEGVFIETRSEWDVFQREFLETESGESRTTKWKSIWDEKEINYQNGKTELKELFDDSPFEYPKPVALITKILEGATKEGDVVLDFFAGSGTTAHSTLLLNSQESGNRRFILVQLPEPTTRSDFSTIAEITKERARRVTRGIQVKREVDANQKQAKLDFDEAFDRIQSDLGFRVFKLDQSNFNAWNSSVEHDSSKVERQLDLHIDHIRDCRTPEDILYELLLKSGFPLTTPVEQQAIEGKTVYSIAGGALMICLDGYLTLELIRAIADLKPERVVFLDECFAGNDQLKANAVQTFKVKGVASFRTV